MTKLSDLTKRDEFYNTDNCRFASTFGSLRIGAQFLPTRKVTCAWVKMSGAYARDAEGNMHAMSSEQNVERVGE